MTHHNEGQSFVPVPCGVASILKEFKSSFLDWHLEATDNVILGIYTVEVILLLYVWRKAFFKHGWFVLGIPTTFTHTKSEIPNAKMRSHIKGRV